MKKIMAVLLFLTFPIWLLPVILGIVLYGVFDFCYFIVSGFKEDLEGNIYR